MAAAAATAESAGTLVGPAGGTWEQGTAARAQCACCGSWVTDERVWRYWVGLVCHLTVCSRCPDATYAAMRRTMRGAS